MVITETPENWVILKLPNGNHKVFATWNGEYLTGQRWRLNSGIKEVKEDEGYWYFIGYSGSCYKCNKSAYGVTNSFGLSVLEEILEKSSSKIETMKGENLDSFKWYDDYINIPKYRDDL